MTTSPLPASSRKAFTLIELLVVIAIIGTLGCLLVIPFTAASILRVAFQKDTETEIETDHPRTPGTPIH